MSQVAPYELDTDRAWPVAGRQLADAELVIYEEEGHLGPMRHWKEMLRAVTTGAEP